MVVTVAISAVTGASSGYFVPWFAWQIEQRRETRTRRLELVKEWRAALLDIGKYPAEVDDQDMADKILGFSAYSSLEPHLSEVLKAKIRELAAPDIIMGRASGRRSPGPPPRLLRELSAEVARIEKDWGLV